MFLVDTTVWIDYFSGKETPQVAYLITAISQHENICLCSVVLTEILQGISNNKEYEMTLQALSALILLPMTQATFILAANIYRSLRARGVTIRKTIDCLIAAVCIENNIPFLHSNRDFDPIEKYCKLKIAR